VQKWHLNNFSDLFYLLFAAANVIVSHIRLVLNSHHSYSWVDLRRQWQLDRDFSSDLVGLLAPNSHAFLDIGWSQFLVQADHIFAVVLKTDNVLGLLGARIDDLDASADQKGFLLNLLVLLEVPGGSQCQSRVCFFDAAELSDFLVKSLNFIFNLLERIVIGTLTITFIQLDVLLRKWLPLVVFRNIFFLIRIFDVLCFGRSLVCVDLLFLRHNNLTIN